MVLVKGGCGGHRNGCFSDGMVWWWACGGCNEQRDWYRGNETVIEMTRTAKGCLIFCLWFFYTFVWIWWWCWCGFGCAHWCFSVLFRRNFFPLGGAVGPDQ